MATTGENVPPAPASTAAPVPPGPLAPQYEFSTRENAIIADVAAKMHFLGMVVLAFGVLMLIVGVLSFHTGLTLTSIIFLCTGIFAISASGALHDVVSTTGRDISHLMAALEHIRRACTLLYWLLLLGLIGLIVLAALAHYGYLEL